MVRKTDIAGRLRHTITIQQTTQTQSTSGAVSDSWGTFATVRAEIRPLSGREYLESNQVNAEEITRFTIRYLADITTKMRILWGTRTYDIRSIMNISQVDKLMELRVVEDV
jgi:SPP1 family predicted phage head-tail adaptor